MRDAGLLERLGAHGEARVLVQRLRVELRGEPGCLAPALASARERALQQLAGDAAASPVAFDGDPPDPRDGAGDVQAQRGDGTALVAWPVIDAQAESNPSSSSSRETPCSWQKTRSRMASARESSSGSVIQRMWISLVNGR